MIAFLKFYLLPILLFGIAAGSFRISQTLGIIISICFGYWFLDSLINESHSYWFKGIAIALILVVNATANTLGEEGDNYFLMASGFFSTGFLIALLKYWFF